MKKKTLWMYAALAIGCALLFAGCEAIEAFFGASSQNPPDNSDQPISHFYVTSVGRHRFDRRDRLRDP